MAQIEKTKIESELHRLAKLIGAKSDQLPTIDNSREARPNISFSSNGTAYYEAHERGDELFSLPAFDLEQLMFIIFKDVTRLMASKYECQNRIQNEDSRRQLFSKQVELMGTLDRDWAKRTQKEIDEVIRRFPFNDQLATK